MITTAPVDEQAILKQLAFEKTAEGYIEAIAGEIHTNEHLAVLLGKVPANCRRGLYNMLRPRLKFYVKPFILFR